MAEAGRLKGVADEGGYWPDFESNEEALGMLVRAIERAGFRPMDQVAIALDIAASSFGEAGRYRLGLEGRELDTEGMIAAARSAGSTATRSSRSRTRWPRTTPQGFVRFTAAVGGRCQVVGDDFLVTERERVHAAAAARACTTVLLKPNQCGTLTETKAAWDAAREVGMGAIVSARSGETEDVTIVHLAVGWGVPELKVGSFSRSERMAKWNEGLRIEEALGGRARFAGRAALAQSLPGARSSPA